MCQIRAQLHESHAHCGRFGPGPRSRFGGVPGVTQHSYPAYQSRFMTQASAPACLTASKTNSNTTGVNEYPSKSNAAHGVKMETGS